MRDRVAQLPAAALQAESGPPDWIMLLPAGVIRTADGRGPYRVPDPAAFVAAHAAPHLPVDENHSTDLAAPQGGPSPARGWIDSLESRADGIWGHVDWSASGKELLADRAYRFISPVITHRRDGTVTGLLRASLTNRPNLRGMAALHSEESDMNVLDDLRQALGLPDDADAAAAIAAVKELKGSTATHAALQSQVGAIAKAAGLKEDADAAAVLGAVSTLADPAKRVPADQVAALQAQLTQLTQNLGREKATTAVDAAIAAGKVGVKALRDHYIARHMADAAGVEKEFAGLPSLTGTSAARATPPTKQQASGELSENQARIVALMGIDPKEYAKTRAILELDETAL